ncbi:MULTISPECIES: hypothetical protein [Aminobacterium]|uniref:hypothetical protein n=1 Tax=Aminobacterium TaxID=81466 RepID=UPI0004BC29DB|nr:MULTISPECIES: hypothetical protein [Aminobacterium]
MFAYIFGRAARIFLAALFSKNGDGAKGWTSRNTTRAITDFKSAVIDHPIHPPLALF